MSRQQNFEQCWKNQVVHAVNSISKQVEFRVHWLPSYIKDSFVEDSFRIMEK